MTVATVQQYTDPYIATYRRVPPAGDGICAVCHSGPGEGFRICHSCNLTMGQVRFPVDRIVPISLYVVLGQYWHVLRNYKDSPDQQVRGQFATIVAATIARFTATHWGCLTTLMGGTPTVVTTVPSTGGRQGEHPLATAVQRSPLLRGLYRPLLGRGPEQIGHRQANDKAFIAVKRLAHARVLLIEDTFTSGARTQSAASALQAGGAHAVAVVTAGRVIDPGWNTNCERIWNYASEPFDFQKCCLCSPDQL